MRDAGCRGEDRRRALLVAALALLVYNANFRVITEGDSRPARLLPFALLRAGSLTLDSVAGPATLVEPNRHYSTPYWLWRSPAGHLLSIYPVVTPLLVTPLYAPAVALLRLQGWEDWRLGNRAIEMEKLSASSIAALSAALFYLLVRRRLAPAAALLLTAAYAFGTSTWTISSQALWQHGTGELLLVTILLAASRAPTARTLAMGGAACGLLAGNRPPDALLACPLLLYLLWRGRQRPARASLAAVAAAAALAPVVAYNLHFFGHPAGGYGVIGLAGPHPFYSHPLLAGLAGLLISPARGLLIFSPFLAFLTLVPAARRPSAAVQGSTPAGALAAAAAPASGQPAAPPDGTGAGPAREVVAGARDGADRWLTLCVALGVACQLLFYARADWRAGACYGPRFMCDALPALVWLLAPVAARLHGWKHGLFVLCVAASIAIQGIGAFCYPGGGSDDLFYPANQPRGSIASSVWSPANAPFLVEARAGLASPDLLIRLLRSLDRARRPHRAASPPAA